MIGCYRATVTYVRLLLPFYILNLVPEYCHISGFSDTRHVRKLLGPSLLNIHVHDIVARMGCLPSLIQEEGKITPRRETPVTKA